MHVFLIKKKKVKEQGNSTGGLVCQVEGFGLQLTGDPTESSSHNGTVSHHIMRSSDTGQVWDGLGTVMTQLWSTFPRCHSQLWWLSPHGGWVAEMAPSILFSPSHSRGRKHPVSLCLVFWIWIVSKVYGICYNIASVLCFGFLALRHVGA